MGDSHDDEQDVANGLVPMAILRERYSEDNEEEDEKVEADRSGAQHQISSTQTVVKSLDVRYVVNCLADGIFMPGSLVAVSDGTSRSM